MQQRRQQVSKYFLWQEISFLWALACTRSSSGALVLVELKADEGAVQRFSLSVCPLTQSIHTTVYALVLVELKADEGAVQRF